MELRSREIYLENTGPNPKSKSGWYNKFYRMTKYRNQDGWVANSGPIGKPGVEHNYAQEKWSVKLNEKLNKGYELIYDTSFDKSDTQQSGENVDKAKDAIKNIDKVIAAINNHIIQNKLNTINKTDLMTANKIREAIESFNTFPVDDVKTMQDLWKTYKEYKA